MKHLKLTRFFITALILACGFFSGSQIHADTLQPIPVTESIRVDGRLSEKVWQSPPLCHPFITFSPNYGDLLEEQTRIWIAYDKKNLYVAFKCLDSRPDGIKTSISRRDSFGSDDWVGLAVDTTNGRQASSEFYVNPYGIQLDGVTSAANSSQLNAAVDFVWESAGILTDSGYQVEIAIPFRSLRFRSGDSIDMGFVFFRHVNRLGKMGSWPAIPAGQSQFVIMSPATFSGIKSRMKMELLPAFTFSFDKERQKRNEWDAGTGSGSPGLTMKYGVSSSITAEATVNPDFSQVESDSFQVNVNQRYPLFFSEKRPFFMEGSETFEFGAVNDGMLYTAVHTRHIADPAVAAKFSGTAGRSSFALLSAIDSFYPQTLDSTGDREHVFWTVLRSKFHLRKDNALGIIYSGHYNNPRANSVFGVDLQYRLQKRLRLSAAWLFSSNRYSESAGTENGIGTNAMLQYSSRKLDSWSTIEYYDRNFFMASAFMLRNHFKRMQFFLGPNFYPGAKSWQWLKRIRPFVRYSALHDFSTNLNDSSASLGLSLVTELNGSFSFSYNSNREGWLDTVYPLKYFIFSTHVQPAKWLRLSAAVQWGDQIYYDTVSPFSGPGNRLALGVTLQPMLRLKISANWETNRMRRRKDNSQVYRIHVYNFFSTYQFNRHFFVRCALRYNDYHQQLLSDLLASFTLIPGTVAHLGYGSLFRRQEWPDHRGILTPAPMLNIRNSLFFKVSYLWRL